MKRFLAAAFALALLAQPALAQFSDPQPAPRPSAAAPGVQIGVTPVAPAPAAAPPVTQNTVTTTGPVSSETTISAGTLAGQFLEWATLAFGSVISTALTALIVKLLQNAGVQGTELLSDKLDRMILNGINLGASTAQAKMAGKGQVEIKNAVTAQAIAYVQAHGAETIKSLGLDPQSGKAVEAIRARIETAIADPAKPTAAVLDAPAKVEVPPPPPPENPA